MPRRRGGFGLASLRRELHLHNLFRDSPRRDASSSASQRDSAGLPVSATFSAHLTPSVPTSVHARRESFLYRPSEDTRDVAPRPVSRASSVASNDHGYVHQCLFYTSFYLFVSFYSHYYFFFLPRILTPIAYSMSSTPIV
ncbi:unnamed protein product [Haemonchus placei]|uniref:Uncharacterized protein n=1 Tax=Haemonchus placei TaxID=6290 RepID=A0A0N4VUR4_HAEPC|nr:unnamed protein product [Haemonchus placei]